MPFPFAGEILSLLCAVAWALALVYFRKAGASVPAVELNLVKNSLATVLLMATWGLLWGVSPAEHGYAFSLKECLYLALSGLVGITLADTLLLKSLSLIGASRNAVISCLFSPFVITLSVLFLGEQLKLIQLVGFGIILIGTMLVSFQKADMAITPAALRNGIMVGILSVFFIAVGMTITKPIVNNASPVATASIRMAAGMVGSLIWIGISGRTSRSLTILKGPLPWKVICVSTTLGSYLALMLWIAGFKLTDASVASMLNQTSVIFTLIFAATILKEQMGMRKVLGAGFGLLGVIVLLLVK